MNFQLKAGIASAAVAVVALSGPGFAADLGGGRGGSLKDHGYQPLPAISRGPAGPCYFRADVGYSHSVAPEVGFPTAIQTNTTNIFDNGVDPATGNAREPTRQQLTNRQEIATEASRVKIEDTWLGEVGVGCGSGSFGLRAEAMLGFRGDRKIDGEPGGGATDFFVIRNVTNDFRTNTNTRNDSGNTGDPLHTSLRTYTAMVNVYKDLGNYGGITPYVGAGIGAAYHQLDEVFFTRAANLSNRIKGDTDIAFAWSLMAGIGYQVSDRAILDFGYRYIDLGKAVSQRSDSAGFINPRVVVDDITAHEFKVGLRYHFGSTDCCAQPAYAPLK